LDSEKFGAFCSFFWVVVISNAVDDFFNSALSGTSGRGLRLISIHLRLLDGAKWGLLVFFQFVKMASKVLIFCFIFLRPNFFLFMLPVFRSFFLMCVCVFMCFFFGSSSRIITLRISASTLLPTPCTFLCQFWIFLRFPAPKGHPD